MYHTSSLFEHCNIYARECCQLGSVGVTHASKSLTHIEMASTREGATETSNKTPETESDVRDYFNAFVFMLGGKIIRGIPLDQRPSRTVHFSLARVATIMIGWL